MLKIQTLNQPVFPIGRPSTGSRYHLIEAARGGAALWVALFHGIGGLPPSTLPFLLALARMPARWGWLGVHVFFVLSGWCIAERMAKSRAQRESPGHFFQERIIRIYPVYWVVLAVTIAVRAASHSSAAGDLPVGLHGWLGAIFLIDPYFGLSGTFLVVAWTLVYEVGFYACSAAALAVARLPFVGARSLFAAGSLLCFAPWNFHLGSCPWFVLGYWPNFFAGAAAWWAVRRRHRLSGYGVLAAMIAAAIVSGAYGDIERWTALIAACALAACYAWDEQISSHRVVRVLMWVGGFSYSLYLIHFPLGVRLLVAASRFVESSSPLFAVCWIATFGATIAAAWVFCRCIERPLERWRRRRAQQAALIVPASLP